APGLYYVGAGDESVDAIDAAVVRAPVATESLKNELVVGLAVQAADAYRIDADAGQRLAHGINDLTRDDSASHERDVRRIAGVINARTLIVLDRRRRDVARRGRRDHI